MPSTRSAFHFSHSLRVSLAASSNPVGQVRICPTRTASKSGWLRKCSATSPSAITVTAIMIDNRVDGPARLNRSDSIRSTALRTSAGLSAVALSCGSSRKSTSGRSVCPSGRVADKPRVLPQRLEAPIAPRPSGKISNPSISRASAPVASPVSVHRSSRSRMGCVVSTNGAQVSG